MVVIYIVSPHALSQGVIMPKAKFKRIADSKVRMIWVPTEECVEECGAGPAYFWPIDISNVGIPICPECGHEYDYDHTEVMI